MQLTYSDIIFDEHGNAEIKVFCNGETVGMLYRFSEAGFSYWVPSLSLETDFPQVAELEAATSEQLIKKIEDAI